MARERGQSTAGCKGWASRAESVEPRAIPVTAWQDARLQGEHALGSEQPRRPPQIPQLSPTFHSSCPKSGQGASTRPLCSPSALVLIPSETIPRTSEPSHDPSSTLPHTCQGVPQVQDVYLLHVVHHVGDRDCANTRATRALVNRASSATIPPPPVCHTRRGRGEAQALSLSESE